MVETAHCWSVFMDQCGAKKKKKKTSIGPVQQKHTLSVLKQQILTFGGEIISNLFWLKEQFLLI